jgi:hypothetical protein
MALLDLGGEPRRCYTPARKLEPKAVVDLFDGASKYMDTVAPVEEGVPYIDRYVSSQPGFKELINKAIEIVRREPYCFKVTDAYVSGSKGSAGDPVFYVTCDGPNDLPKNFWLSKKEIEDRFEKLKLSGA